MQEKVRHYLLPRLVWLISVASIIFYLSVFVWKIRNFGYVSSPGADQINHFVNVQVVQEFGWKALFQAGYPKGFHALVWLIMQLSGATYSHVLLIIWPTLPVLASLSCAALIQRITNRNWAALSVPVFLFALAQPLQTLEDGGFPSYLGVAIWIPLLLAIVYTVIDKPKTIWPRYMLAACLLLLPLIHHVTLIYVFLTAGIWLFLRYARNLKVLLPVIIGLALLYLSPIGRIGRDVMNALIIVGGKFPWLHSRFPPVDNAMWQWSDYGVGIGYAVWYFGLVGVAVAVFALKKAKPAQKSILQLVLILFALQLIGSRLLITGFPVRIARDLAIPLFILCFFALSRLWQILRTRVGIVGQVLLIAAFTYLAQIHIRDYWERAHTFDPAMQLTSSVERVLQGLPSTAKALNIPFAYLYGVENLNRNIAASAEYPLSPILVNHLVDDRIIVYKIEANEDNWPGPLLSSYGFHEVAHYSDQVKDTYRFEK